MSRFRTCRDILDQSSVCFIVMTDGQKRQYVYNLYDGPKWKKQVERMPDEQIVAIYLKHLDDGQLPDHHETEELEFEEPVEDPTLPLPETYISPSGGPHANEDDFPIY